MTSLAGGVSLYADGINLFSSNISVLPSALDQLIEGQSQLSSAWNSYGGAVSEIHDGTDKLYTETQTLPDNINKIIDGNLKIRDGIQKLKEEGISEIRDMVIENINKVKSGISLTDEINTAYKNYKSFMDNDKNQNSQVQFIIQTEEIKIMEAAVENNVEEIKSEGFLDRLIKLFKNNQ